MYISLSGIFFAAFILLYAASVVFITDLTVNQFFNIESIYRAFFAWGFTYAFFEIEYWQRNSVRVWLLKWASIYVTGFLTTRAVFNWFVSEKMTYLEGAVMIVGAVITVIMSIKSRNGNS